MTGREICDNHSESLAMLFRGCFTEQATYQEILPDGYVSGDVLMVETVRLEPQYRGYGIGLLAMDRLVKRVEQASPEWGDEGLLVLSPSGLMSDMVSSGNHAVVQEKLIRYWETFGLSVLVRETVMHSTFVGHWMGYERPRIETVVPNLLQ